MAKNSALVVVGFIVLIPASVRGDDKIEYNRDIRPILAENCFACHGPDSASRKAKLRLDQFDAAVKAGAITPGKPNDSELVRRIVAEDVNERMPPHEDGQEIVGHAEGHAQTLDRRRCRISAALVVHCRRCGPPLPEVKDKNWVRNPIDRFHPRETGSRWA